MRSLLPLLLATAALLPVHRSEAQTDSFEDRADVVLVEVPVNVTTKSGEPVRGLKAADFEVYDNGKRQEVAAFDVVDLTTVSTESVEGRRQIERIAPVARRHFLLLFDLSFATPSSVARARLAALDFVQKALHPTDLAAVAVYALETGPRLVVTFTPDRAQLARAIDTLGVPQLLGRGQVNDPLRFVIQSPDAEGLRAASEGLVPSIGDGSGRGAPAIVSSTLQDVQAHLQILANRMERSQKTFERTKVSSWSRAMSDMAKALNSVQGRKHVVYFSEGFDGRLLFGRQPSPDDEGMLRDQAAVARGNIWMVDTDDTFGSSALQTDVGKMLEEFRRADCVIQAVDIAGLRAETTAAERALSVGQDALFYVAHETGGQLFSDANDIGDQLSRVLERSTVTYVLGFNPSELKRDGSYRRLNVKVANLPKGAQVSFRTGYYSPRPFNDLDPLEKSLLASNAIATTAPLKDLDLDVLVAPFKATATSAYVPIIVELGGPSLLVGQKGKRLDVELYAYVTDARGEIRDFFAQVIGVDLGPGTRDALGRTGLKYYGHVSLQPGDYLVRVLARNAESGRAGVATAALSIPTFQAKQPAVLPPFFIEEPGSWVLVKERPEEGEGKSIVYPFTINGEPYIPAARPALKAGREAELCVVAYHMGEGSLDVQGRVTGADGREIEGGRLALRERTLTGVDGVDKLLMTFDPRGLGAGDYTLEVAVVDPGTGSRQMSSIPFSVLN